MVCYLESEMDLLSHLIGDQVDPDILKEAFHQTVEELSSLFGKGEEIDIRKMTKSFRARQEEAECQVADAADPDVISRVLIKHNLLSEDEWKAMVGDFKF